MKHPNQDVKVFMRKSEYSGKNSKSTFMMISILIIN